MLFFGKTFFEQYKEFAAAMDIPQGDINGSINLPQVQLALNLIKEEFEVEFKDAILKFGESPSRENLVEVADALADTIYVICQLAHVLDIPLDLVYAEVHANNMTKMGPDGKAIKREDGKVLKPAGYKPVDLWSLLAKYSDMRACETGAHGAENWNSPIN